jgi:hypothetical protein
MTKEEYIERLPDEVKKVSRKTANKLNLQRMKISAVVATNADGKDYIQRKMTKKQLEDLLLDVYHHIKSEVDTHQQVARAMTSLNAMS